jgi:hypothetical protein
LRKCIALASGNIIVEEQGLVQILIALRSRHHHHDPGRLSREWPIIVQTNRKSLDSKIGSDESGAGEGTLD